MRKLFTIAIVFACLVLLGNSAMAQSNVIKINLLSPIVRTLNMSYEKTLSESSSLQLGLAYTGASISDTKLSGIQVTPEYRFYLSETAAPDGFYVAPFLRYSSLSLTDESGITDSEATLSSFGGGLVVGNQWIFKERISLDAFIGPSFVSGSLDVTSGSEEDFSTGIFDGFGVRLGLTLGVAF